ncbi:hypothetical protein V9T40_010415 [Parthenolecanium corni]|uniref:Uncharacterized protein n=1 Tax=Parthenolecanium corni TaxID=536013 RepID=A0AAN9T8Q5_9HEMI
MTPDAVTIDMSNEIFCTTVYATLIYIVASTNCTTTTRSQISSMHRDSSRSIEDRSACASRSALVHQDRDEISPVASVATRQRREETGEDSANKK